MSPQAPQRAFQVYAAVIIVMSGLLLALGPRWGHGSLYPAFDVLRRDAIGAVSSPFLAVLAYAIAFPAAMYAAGWAIWWRRPWGRALFLVAFPLYVIAGFLGFAKGAPPWWASLLVLFFPFALLLATGSRWRAATASSGATAVAVTSRSARYVGLVLLVAAGFLVSAVFALSRITADEVRVFGFLESAIPAAAAFLLLGIPLATASPAGGGLLRIGAAAAAVIAIALAIPVVVSLARSIPKAPAVAAKKPEPPQTGPTSSLPPPTNVPTLTPPALEPAPSTSVRPTLSSADPEIQKRTIRPPLLVELARLEVVRRVAPSYPEAARGSSKSGAATIEATIDRSGKVTATRVLRGDPEFAEAGKAALAEWIFAPYQVDGEARPVKTVVTFNFRPR